MRKYWPKSRRSSLQVRLRPAQCRSRTYKNGPIGQDTTSSAITWALYALAKAHDAQAKLREEVLAFPNDSPSLDELNTLTYLDYVIKETLRLVSCLILTRPGCMLKQSCWSLFKHIPVPLTQRVPLADVMIPLSSPVIDKSGKEVREI